MCSIGISKYNESLVRRGEILHNFDVIDNWHSELNGMNDGKEGAAYRYPFVQLLGYMKLKKVLSGLMLITKYHSVKKRIVSLNVKSEEVHDDSRMLKK